PHPSSLLQRQPQSCFTSANSRSILESQSTPVCFGDLTRQHQTDSRATRLCCEERNEQVRSIRETWPFVVYPNFNMPIPLSPTHLYAAVRFERCVDCIANKIDQQLFKLRIVSLD